MFSYTWTFGFLPERRELEKTCRAFSKSWYIKLSAWSQQRQNM